MALIQEFLSIISNDDQVKAKTSNKDISFQIDLKDNGESFYIYFNHGEVEAALGAYSGTASVKLGMDAEVFDGLMLGTVNGAKAAMSGKMSFAGDVRKAIGMQSILNLMMKSYQAAIDKVGKPDAAAPAAAPVPAPVAAPVGIPAALPVVEPGKQGFFGRLFGARTVVRKVVIQQVVIQQMTVHQETGA
jgi:putative sterol carrier protein